MPMWPMHAGGADLSDADVGEAWTFLAPPSPPSAPHLGTVYTWCLLDAAARAQRHLGRATRFPESWNVASRRAEAAFVASPGRSAGEQAHRAMTTAAIDQARTAASAFGIRMDRGLALRDDDPVIRTHVHAVLSGLAERGTINRATVTEKRCSRCQLSVPPTAAIVTCFACGDTLRLQDSDDWFLLLNFDSILMRARAARWMPGFAFHRFADLSDLYPWVRVGHRHRRLGIPSPFDSAQRLDPRLVAALYPSVLRRLGIQGRIVTAAGQDIQRKWLVLVFAGCDNTSTVDVVMNHGLLLSGEGRKMSRYTGATLRDLPEGTDPILFRAAMLGMALGRDFRAAAVPTCDASRLREKVRNTVRYFNSTATENPNGIDLLAEFGPILDEVDTLLARLDLHAAYLAFRHAVRADLSHQLIPRIRRAGCTGAEATVRRVLDLARVFFGDANETQGQASNTPSSPYAPGETRNEGR